MKETVGKRNIEQGRRGERLRENRRDETEGIPRREIQKKRQI